MPQILETYLQYHRVEGSTRDTIRAYRAEVGLFVRFLQGRGHSLVPGDVTSLDIIAHLEDMKVRGLAPRSIRSRYQAISTFFVWAVLWEFVSANPADRLKPPKVPKTRKPFLKPEAFQQLLSLCPLNTFLGARRQSMFWMLLTSGIRHKELASLLLEDLEWQGFSIRVRMGKGQKERRVPFHQETQRALLRYLAHRHDDLPNVWLTEERRPLTYNGVGQDIKRLMAIAGISDQVKDPCHIFRRTWAANAVRQGIPRQYIQAKGGWASPVMIDLYAEAMQDEEGEASEAFRGFDPFGGAHR